MIPIPLLSFSRQCKTQTGVDGQRTVDRILLFSQNSKIATPMVGSSQKYWGKWLVRTLWPTLALHESLSRQIE